MAARGGVWGIDVGQCALKAIKLRTAEDGAVEVVAFDLIEHPKILSQPDAEPDELIKAALEKFISRNDWQGDQFVIGVPGQQTFARFCKLPPVEPKKIPDIVRFEASQQIPFEMDDVVWDYEVFKTEDDPDVEVGIFAMRKDLIRKQLDRFSDLNVAPQAIQTMPSALYNFCRYDLGDEIEENVATVVIDVGAQNTDLIIVEPHSAWTRNIPLGGNNFTEALVKAFKLSFAKAESLKRTASTSKYARQIFQAMRPVFAELVAEVQRSLGFYGSTHRDVELKQVLACGNAFRLPGLQKYLENNLTISGGVKKLEKFRKAVDTATITAPQFADNVLSFGAAYGLAIQGLDLAPISANLLPPELARIAMWRKKRPYFAAAAAATLIAAMMPWARVQMDKSALGADSRVANEIRSAVQEARNFQEEYDKVAQNNEADQKKIEQLFELQENRDVVPRIMAFVHDALPEIDPKIAACQTPEELKKLIESDKGRYQRTARGQILIDAIEMHYADDIDNMDRAPASRRGMTTGGAVSRSFSPSGMGGRSLGGGGGMGGPRSTGGGMGRPGARAPMPSASDGESSGGTSDGAAGFYVILQGRILYGTERSQAAELLFGRFYTRLLEMGHQAGLGFWVPEKDPKSSSRRGFNLNDEIMIQQVYNTQTPGGMPAMGGRPGMSDAAPTGAETTPEQENIVLFPDPVTGEDMVHDWSFELGFKIKLGEPPKLDAEPKADGDD